MTKKKTLEPRESHWTSSFEPQQIDNLVENCLESEAIVCQKNTWNEFFKTYKYKKGGVFSKKTTEKYLKTEKDILEILSDEHLDKERCQIRKFILSSTRDQMKNYHYWIQSLSRENTGEFINGVIKSLEKICGDAGGSGDVPAEFRGCESWDKFNPSERMEINYLRSEIMQLEQAVILINRPYRQCDTPETPGGNPRVEITPEIFIDWLKTSWLCKPKRTPPWPMWFVQASWCTPDSWQRTSRQLVTNGTIQ